jgi:PAS domain S-box-containing protein
MNAVSFVSFRKLTHSKPFRNSLIVVLLLSIIASLVTSYIYSITLENERTVIRNLAESKKNQIELIVSHALTATKTLRRFVEDNPSEAEYPRAIERIYYGQSDIIDALELAPDGIVRYVYPEKANAKVIGFNILHDSLQKFEAQQAIAANKLIFAGPLELIQGGIGIVGRMPIFLPSDSAKVFYGFSIAIIRLDRLLEKSSMTALTDQGYQFQLSRMTEDGTVKIFSGGALPLNDPIVVEIPLHNMMWYLSVEPAGGWKSAQKIIPFVISSTSLVLLFGIFVWFLANQPHQLQKMVRMKVAELTESENRFRATFEQAAVGIAHVGLDGRWLRINQKLCDFLGFTREEMLSQQFQDLTHPEDLSQDIDSLQLLLNGSIKSYTREKRYRQKNGEYRWGELTVALLFDANRQPQYFISVIQDIDNRKKIEQEILLSSKLLRDSEQKFKDIIHNAPLVLLAVDANGIFTHSDGKGLHGTGLVPGQVVGMNAFQMYGQINIICTDGNILKGDEVIRRVLQGETIHGLTELNGIHFENTFTPHLDETGAVVGMIGISFNITEKLLAQRESQTAAERYRIVGEMTTNILWDWDIEQNTLWWSGEHDRYDKHSTDAAQAFDQWKSHIHPEDSSRITASLTTAMNSGVPEWSEEYRYQRHNGESVFVRDNARIIRNNRGDAVRIVGGITNINRQKEYETQLMRVNDSLQTIINSSPAAIFDLTIDGKVRSIWNSSAGRLFGWTRDEIIGSSLSILGSDKASDLQALLEKVAIEGIVNDLVVSLVTKTGERKHVSMNIAAIRDRDNQMESFISVVIDITEKKKMEEQFLRMQRLESIGTLASGIAHDLNNVLGPILLGIELLKRNPEGRNHREVAIRNIESSATRGRDIIRQILNFSKGGDQERYAIQLKHLGYEIESLIKETFPKSITVRTNFFRELWPVSGNVTQLHQVMMNLCINARDAMPDGGTLTISMENRTIDDLFSKLQGEVKPGNYIEITVADTGHGIPKEIQDKVFEPFFSTKDPGHGTGLGLSTVKNIVKSHEGFLKLYSEPNKGTEFKVFIPAAITDAPPLDQELTDMPHGNGEHILVIDDEQSIIEITKQMLEAYGYVVTTAGDGAEALAIFTSIRNTVSIVITDVNMPVIDGITTAIALKKQKPSLRFIISSGLADEANLSKLTSIAVDGFLQKPYSAPALLKIIKEVKEKI